MLEIRLQAIQIFFQKFFWQILLFRRPLETSAIFLLLWFAITDYFYGNRFGDNIYLFAICFDFAP